MKLHSFNTILTIAACLAATLPVSAASVELVTNGEFEVPVITGSFNKIPGGIPGWSNTDNPNDKIELWKQGGINSPQTGSDNIGTGQHMELTVDSGGELNTQSFTIPLGTTGLADFSFDVWFRSAGTIDYSVDGTDSGSILSGTINSTNVTSGAWTNVSFNSLPVTGNETVKLQFSSLGSISNPLTNSTTDGGGHIDQVSFRVDVIPEPAGLAMLLVGAGVACTILRRRRNSN